MICSSHRIFRVSVDNLHYEISLTPNTILGARVYYLKNILHDWSDSQCRQILGSIRGAMRRGYSKIVIEEFVIPVRDVPLLQSMWDLEMLVWCGSMERTQDGWRGLLASTGFGSVRFWPPPGDGHWIIEVEID